MAITIDSLVQEGTFDVILKSDPALDVTDEEYGEYLKTMDPNKLKLRQGAEATTFTMLRKMKYSHRQWVDAAKLKVDRQGEMSINLFEYMMREVRATLVGIKSPESVPEDKRPEKLFKKTGDGLVEENFAVALGDMVGELFNARTSHLEAGKAAGKADLKKD